MLPFLFIHHVLQKQENKKDSDYTDIRDMSLAWHGSRHKILKNSSFLYEAQTVDLVKVNLNNV